MAPVYFTVFVLSALGSLSFYILLSGVALQDDLLLALCSFSHLLLPDRMLMPEWRGSRRISSDFLRVRLRHCHLHLLRFPGGGARWRLHAALAVPDACDRAQHGDQQAAAKREPNREAGAGIRIVAGTTGP